MEWNISYWFVYILNFGLGEDKTQIHEGKKGTVYDISRGTFTLTLF